jgi:hypothetical protein
MSLDHSESSVGEREVGGVKEGVVRGGRRSGGGI